MSMNVGPSAGDERRNHLDHQHHAAGRRDAGAADHLPDHHSGRHDVDSRSRCRRKRNEIRETKPENITISVDAKGRIFWNELRDRLRRAALIDRLKKISVIDAAARGPDSRRRHRALRRRRPHHLRLPARGHRQGRVHHRAADTRRLSLRGAANA